MQRNILGIVALALIGFGSVGLLFGFSTNSQSGMAAGVGLRAGLILGAFWIAYPQLIQTIRRSPKWIVAGLVTVGSLVVLGPRGLVIAVPVLVVLAALHFVSYLIKPLPKKKRSAPHGPSPEKDLARQPRRRVKR